MASDLLPRATRPLTDAHRALLRLLAQRMVDEFLAETLPTANDQAKRDDKAVLR